MNGVSGPATGVGERGPARRREAMFTNILTLLVVLTLSLYPTGADRQERIQLEYTLPEENTASNIVGQIGSDATIVERYGADVYGNIKFEFLKKDEPNRAYFTIDQSTGELRTKRIIDREEICAQKLVCILKFDVAISPVPVRYLEVVTVKVLLEDINDNPPTFPKPRMSMAVSESVMPGVSFVIPAARDPDSGRNAIQSYDFRSRSRKFELRAQNTSDGAWDLKLVLRDRLDREDQEAYTMRIIARDGGSPPKSGVLTVEVSVVDANDNPPKFDNASYDVSVREDSRVGSMIIRVHATDKDRGPNGRVTYMLSPDTVDRFGSLFGINNQSGDIFLKGSLDYEKDKIYHLIVIASDQGGLDSVSTHARVVVKVKDVNDHPPKITVNSLTPSGEVQIPENAEPSTFVTHISVEDSDKGENGEVTCSLKDRNFDISRIYQNEYTIFTVGGSFDREKQATFGLTLACNDHGVPPLQSTKRIVVKLLDENDHPPIFNQDVYDVTVRENGSINERLLRVNATDLDAGQNAEITYSLHPDARGLVKVDPKTGVIITNSLLDYEKMHQFQFRVIASDNGLTPLSATTTVILKIVDINDESPVFRRPAYEFNIDENSDGNTEVGSVKAVDPDSNPYNRVSYTLRADMGSRGAFQINPDTGMITTRRPLDREYQAIYRLTVMAGNRGFPFTTSSVSVTISVADRNDNDPLISYPRPVNNTVQVSYMAPVGYVITRVMATDADESVNARLDYSISRGNLDDLFAIDPLNGAITVNQNLELFGGRRYRLLLRVSDNGLPPRQSSADINIIVNKTMSLISHRKGGANGNSLEMAPNQTIVISMGVASAVLVILLIVAIILVHRKKKKRNHRDSYKYMRRVDLEHQSPSPKHIPTMRRVETDEKVANLSTSKSDAGDGLKTHLRFELDTSDLDEKLTSLPSPAISRTNSNIITQKDGRTRPEECPMTTFRYQDQPERPEQDRDSETEERELELERERRGREREPPPPPAPEDPHTCSRPTKVMGDPREPRYQSLPRHRLLYDPQHGLPPSAALTQKDLEVGKRVHQLLHRMMQDAPQDSDSASGCSADMSNTDSGRGPSEDGDNHGVTHHHHHSNAPGTPGENQPPPPPYESLWSENRRTASTNDMQGVDPSREACRERNADVINPQSRTRLAYGSKLPSATAGPPPTDNGPLHIRRFPPNCNQLRPPGARYAVKTMPRIDHNGIREQLAKIHNSHMPVSQCGVRPIPPGAAPVSSASGMRGADHADGSTPHKLPNGHQTNNNDLSKYGRANGDGSVATGESEGHGRTFTDARHSPQLSPSRSCTNTFGHTGPLRPLGKVDESRDEVSDDSTTTSGSFELHGDATSPHGTVRKKMDTVV